MSEERERSGAESFPTSTHAERSVTRTEAGMVGYEYSGPLPPPIVLRHLEEILPGSAERIFNQFEKQAEHRRHSEMIVISSNAFAQRLGAVSATIIGIGGMGGAIWLLAHGQASQVSAPYSSPWVESSAPFSTKPVVRKQSGFKSVKAKIWKNNHVHHTPPTRNISTKIRCVRA